MTVPVPPWLVAAAAVVVAARVGYRHAIRTNGVHMLKTGWRRAVRGRW